MACSANSCVVYRNEQRNLGLSSKQKRIQHGFDDIETDEPQECTTAALYLGTPRGRRRPLENHDDDGDDDDGDDDGNDDDDDDGDGDDYDNFRFRNN